MELTQLRQFKEIAKCESLTKAAENLYISQSALSQSLSKLEKELGQALFDRTKNKIIMNEAGKLAYSFAVKITAQADEMLELFNAQGRKEMKLTFFSSSVSAVRYLLPKLVNLAPEIKIVSALKDQSELKQALLDGECDVAFSTEPLTSPAITNLPFCEDVLTVWVPKANPIAQKRKVAFSELKGQSIARPYDISYMSKMIDYLNERDKVGLNQVFLDDYMVYREMLKNTDYLAFVSTMGVPYYDKNPERVYVRLTDKELRMPINIAFLKKNRPRAGAVLHRMLIDYKNILR